MTEADGFVAALAAVQAELTAVKKGETADTGSYTYRYADLADVARVVYPLLAKYGLAFVCQPDYIAENRYVLIGSLEHVSGGRRTGNFPLNDRATPQQIGSAMTYGRRYLLGCLTGVVAEEDDDGKAASAAPPAKKPPAKKAAPRKTLSPTAAYMAGVQEPREPAPEWDDFSKQEAASEPRSDELITEPQRSRVFLLLNANGIKKRDDRLAYVSGLIKRDIASINELTKSEASQVIDHFESFLAQEPS